MGISKASRGISVLLQHQRLCRMSVSFKGLAMTPWMSLAQAPGCDECVILGPWRDEGRLNVRRYSFSKVLPSISPAPLLFNVSAAQRTLLMASSKASHPP